MESSPKTASAPRATYARIYAAVDRVPRGRVATYGQIASLAGLPGHARMVGYALSALREGSRVPWHRVVNAAGRISLRSDGRPMGAIQRFLLEKEGVRFGASGAIPLQRFRWQPAADGPRASRTTRSSAGGKMKRRAVLWIILATFGLAVGRTAAGQEACKTLALKNPAVKLSDMWTMADKYAKAWKPDAVPARITNTSLGPLQPDGSSTAWNLMFFSAQSNASVSISTFRGSLTCWAQPGPAGRLPDLKPDFFRDGAALYGLAKKHGEALLKEGYTVSLGTAAAPSNRHATWYINYGKENGKDAPLSVVVNANTGAVEDVIKH